MDSSDRPVAHRLTLAARFCLLSLAVLIATACDRFAENTSVNPAVENPDDPSIEQATHVEELFLQVGAVFNEDTIQVRLRFETDNPSWYHQYWVFDGEAWQRVGSGNDERDADGFYEDRISIMWDDGSVEGFDVMGGFIAVHQGMRATRSEVTPEVVSKHPILGEELGLDEITKFIPESRLPSQTSLVRWQDVRPTAELQQLREQGVFIDLWQWRAHRSHPIGFADNGYVLEARHGSQGKPMFTTNQDPESGLPAWMFNPEFTGFNALSSDDLRARKYEQDDHYFLLMEDAIPFEADYDWQTGDAIPHRVLQQPEGSRGAIRSSGSYRDGAWDIVLTRSLASPNPLDSKTLEPGKVYNVAFAIHQATGTRHHAVSVPMRLGMGVDSDITAIKVEGAIDAERIPLQEIPLFNPGDPTLPASN
jgi:hypothetical protein